MKLNRRSPSTEKNRPSSSRPVSFRYFRQRVASVFLEQQTRPPKPAFRNLWATSRPLAEVFPDPVWPKIARPWNESRIRHASEPKLSNFVSSGQLGAAST